MRTMELCAEILAKLESMEKRMDDNLVKWNEKLEEMEMNNIPTYSMNPATTSPASPMSSSTSAPNRSVDLENPIVTPELPRGAPIRCSTPGPNQAARVPTPAAASSASPAASPTFSSTLAAVVEVPVVNPELPTAAPTKCSTAGPNQDARLLVAAVASSTSPAAFLGVRSRRIGKVRRAPCLRVPRPRQPARGRRARARRGYLRGSRRHRRHRWRVHQPPQLHRPHPPGVPRPRRLHPLASGRRIEAVRAYALALVCRAVAASAHARQARPRQGPHEEGLRSPAPVRHARAASTRVGNHKKRGRVRLSEDGAPTPGPQPRPPALGRCACAGSCMRRPRPPEPRWRTRATATSASARAKQAHQRRGLREPRPRPRFAPLRLPSSLLESRPRVGRVVPPPTLTTSSVASAASTSSPPADAAPSGLVVVSSKCSGPSNGARNLFDEMLLQRSVIEGGARNTGEHDHSFGMHTDAHIAMEEDAIYGSVQQKFMCIQEKSSWLSLKCMFELSLVGASEGVQLSFSVAFLSTPGKDSNEPVARQPRPPWISCHEGKSGDSSFLGSELKEVVMEGMIMINPLLLEQWLTSTVEKGQRQGILKNEQVCIPPKPPWSLPSLETDRFNSGQVLVQIQWDISWPVPIVVHHMKGINIFLYAGILYLVSSILTYWPLRSWKLIHISFVQFCYKPIKQITIICMNDKKKLWPMWLKLDVTIKADVKELIVKALLDDIDATTDSSCGTESPLMVYVSKIISAFDKSRFFALGQLFSGRVTTGRKVPIMGTSFVHGKKKDLYMKNAQCTVIWLGKNQESVDVVPCSNTLAMIGLDQFITKSATLTIENEVNACPLRATIFFVPPVMHVAVKCKNDSYFPKLVEGLKHLARSDPMVVSTISMSSEHIVTGVRGIQLDMSLRDLKDTFMSGFQETPWDPGGFQQRLEGKPHFKRGRMSCTGPPWLGCLGPMGRTGKKEQSATDKRNGGTGDWKIKQNQTHFVFNLCSFVQKAFP